MMTCLIVDDEKLSIELLEDNVRRISFLSLVGACRSASEALEIMVKQKVDLIFLDIKMPGTNGVELIKSLQKPPLIIFVTAFEHHALEAFKLNVVDYLLKPVIFERFLIASEKALDLYTLRYRPTKDANLNFDHIFVNAGYSLIKVRLQEITYIEGLRDYVKIHLENNKPIITRIRMHDLSEKLSSNLFMRIHKSFIVSVDHIESVQKHKIIVGGKEIPIGETYRDDLQSHISKRNII